MFKKNILITGGAGYIGSHIVEKLVKNKFKVFIYDNLVTGHKLLINKKANFIEGDLNDFKKLKRVIKNNNITSIVHLAAYLNIKESEKKRKKYYKNNVGGTLNLLKACIDSKVKNLIFSSSCSVYGNVKGSVSERGKLRPSSYYAFTKLKSEKIIQKYSKILDINYAILRYFNVAGASNSGKIGEVESSHDHLIKNLAIQALKENPKVYIYGNNYNTKDGTCVRDYIHVSDLADIHIKTLKKISIINKSLILNCGYGRGYSVKEIIDVYKKLKKNVKIKYLKKRPGDIAKIYSNISQIKKILNWKPKYDDLNKILISSINWEKKIDNGK